MDTLDASLDSVRLTPAYGDPHARWRACNDAGVSFALEGRWPDALTAFSDALTEAPAFADAPDVHALLHGNRAQAHFHCGELQGAVDSARRALAARLVCGDSEDAPVARIRADLGVYLAACGAVSEAEQSLQQSRTSLEARFGGEDSRLLTVLENQARVQLLAHRPEAAEPLLLRLHALLVERGLATASITPLFDAVRRAREPEADSAATSLTDEFAELDVFPSASGAPPVSDAVPEAPGDGTPHPDSTDEDSLLVFDALDALDALDETDELIDDDVFDLIDAEDYPPMRSPSPAAIRSAGLIEPGTHATPQEAIKRTHPLGFEIQYGIPQDLLLDGDAA